MLKSKLFKSLVVAGLITAISVPVLRQAKPNRFSLPCAIKLKKF